MRYLLIITAVIGSIFLVRCAQPRNLSGGAKDTHPPKVLKLSPQNLSTGFQGHTIAMEFDEYVQIVALNSELIVSPPLQYPVTYRQKGKRVFFDIEDTLKSNTTYNFNFGNAIVDLNENNPLDSNLFVFSTGTTIDSGLIYGTVIDAYTGAKLKGISVVLYNQTEDSSLYNGNPLYITKTNAQGEFQLRFLQNTNYQIFALQTPGDKFKFVPQTKVGFVNSTVNSLDEKPIDLAIFKQLDTTQYVTKSFSKDYYSFNIGFNNELDQPTFEFTPPQKTINYITEEIRKDTFKFWIPGDLDLDSVTVRVKDNKGFSDTISIDLSDRSAFMKKQKKKKLTTHPLKIRLATKNGVHHYFDTLRLNFSRPVQQWAVDSMSFVQNEDTMSMREAIKTGVLDVTIPTKKHGSSNDLRSIALTHKWEPSTDYSFIFNSGSFTDIIKQTNDTSILKFRTNNFEDYGSFRFKVETPNYTGALILELLDEKGAFLRSYYVKSGEEIYRELAVPGTYKFRLILDENDNKKWDTGSLRKESQPERVFYYPGSVEIRANWDMEEVWKVDL